MTASDKRTKLVDIGGCAAACLFFGIGYAADGDRFDLGVAVAVGLQLAEMLAVLAWRRWSARKAVVSP